MNIADAVKGRTIRIYLADGAPTGILTAEIMNWTGKVVVAPRTRLPDLLKRPEASRTGVYFLTGQDPENMGRDLVYIGETDNVGERLKKHNADEGMGFFDRICMVVSTDGNLTKTHVRYLEGRLLTLTKAANRATLVNRTEPAFNKLPESERADMESFIEQIALVLPVLGFEFMQKFTAVQPGSAATSSSPSDRPEFEFPPSGGKVVLPGVKATMVEADGKLVVLKGSKARLSGPTTPKMWPTTRALRDRLLAEGKLVATEEPNVLCFAEDVAFNNPSDAAAVVFGGNQNGRLAWHVSGTSQTYRDWQESKINAIAKGDAP